MNRIAGDTTDECPPDTAQVEARRFRIVAENPTTQLPTARGSRSTVVVVGVDGDGKRCSRRKLFVMVAGFRSGELPLQSKIGIDSQHRYCSDQYTLQFCDLSLSVTRVWSRRGVTAVGVFVYYHVVIDTQPTALHIGSPSNALQLPHFVTRLSRFLSMLSTPIPVTYLSAYPAPGGAPETPHLHLVAAYTPLLELELSPTRSFGNVVLCVTAEQLGPNASADLAVWLFFQLAAGHVLLPLLVATFFVSRTVTRRPTVINCVGFTATHAKRVLYVGRETGLDPNQELCIAQSALLSGVLPMTTTACLALVYHAWTSLNRAGPQDASKRAGSLVNALLLGVPYVFFAMFTAIAAKLGTDYPTRVSRVQKYFYCSIDLAPFNYAVAILSALACFGAIALYANISVDFCVRIGVFAVCMLTATFSPLCAACAHSETQDVIHAWLSWRRPKFARQQAPGSPRLPRAPYPSFDLDLMKRTDSAVSEKARLEALRAYYAARVQGEGVGVEIIERPEDAFIPGRDYRSASRLSMTSGFSGKSTDSGVTK
ncbi:hypothetical protein POSPLADRAFT_1048357 [Postia placenta MAD-698-R-SB12]|uniref:Uncharacterized protein n=1 Tax=Postia placenta MAD-698-R-SB12 TaxID=670580 RepID=A0A1X6MUM8_9APHY|nr:hypothetical protein POSPLADRAFT_1048357 [Postia placenta MAD-698-R-SB12]OSX59903.1 hypothetical protein POSPLADRAFT_1048357 [Postia placenta MAD-698-R-SB12]